MDQYHDLMVDLGVSILQVLAQTLSLDKSVFGDFYDYPVSILRLLHYPPQEGSTDLERGETTLCPWTVLISRRNRGPYRLWRGDYAPARRDGRAPGLE